MPSPAALPDPPEVPGYALGERVGSGGTGAVWAAVRWSDGADVAVKVVPVGSGAGAEVAARELAVLGRVEVEGLVGFHEAVGLPGDPAAVALVMQRVTGGSLEQVVRARGHLSVGESVTVLAPVARALAGLHALGVVHGDVTPANVLVDRTGRPVVADLGVARLAGEVPGDVYGTPGFVAPEVLDGAPVTAAADVYAVGALAWWCVTGTAPEPAALRRPLEELVAGLPVAWLAATRAALDGDPLARPDAAALALAYFDSAPCEPLRLVMGGDETALLTRRLRQAAAPAGSSAPTAPEPAHRRPSAAVARLRRVRLRLPPLRLRAPRHGGRAVVALATVLVVFGLGGLASGEVLDPPGWLRPARAAQPPTDRPSPPAGDPVTVRATGRPVATSPVRASGAPRDDPRALMQALSDERAAALDSGSVDRLRALDAPGSSALRADEATLAELSAAGRSYDGVRLVVRSARAVQATAQTAQVEAVVDTAAYRVVDRDGAVSEQAAVRGRPLRFALVWGTGRWQVEAVTAGSAG